MEDVLPTSVKCVVWDLDNTVWHGILQERDDLVLRGGITDIFEELDRRGILQSIASRNEPASTEAQLKAFGIDAWFVHPQINWGAKHESVDRIAAVLNISLDTLLFVDDDPFERAEVQSVLPDVRVMDSRDLDTLLDRADLTPSVVTDEARRRRLMYLADQRRVEAQENFAGPTDEFLATLDSVYVIRPAGPDDLDRAGELTVRTNQLNATGQTFSPAELATFSESADHKLLVMELSDRFGSFGIIGLALVELDTEVWTIKLLLTSCRVMSRGAGSVLLHHLIERAQRNGVRICSQFVHTGRNRVMYAMYKFAGFQETESDGDRHYLERTGAGGSNMPAHARVVADW